MRYNYIHSICIYNSSTVTMQMVEEVYILLHNYQTPVFYIQACNLFINTFIYDTQSDLKNLRQIYKNHNFLKMKQAKLNVIQYWKNKMRYCFDMISFMTGAKI